MGSILNISREYVAPEASDRVYHQVAKFLQRNSTDKTMERNLLEFDILRRTEGARVMMRSASPHGFASILCMQYASLSRTEESLLSLPQLWRNTCYDCVIPTRSRLFDVGVHSGEAADLSYEAWVAYR